MIDPGSVRANAHGVIAWYRRELDARTHDLAFAHAALEETQSALDALRAEVAEVRGQFEALAAQGAPAGPPDPGDAGFGAWVAEHWDAIQDARIAHAVDHPGRPYVPEQP